MIHILELVGALVLVFGVGIYVMSLGPYGRARLHQRPPYEPRFRNPNRRGYSNRTPPPRGD